MMPAVVMRSVALLLVIATVTACRHGAVVVHVEDVASHARELEQKGSVEVPARKQAWSNDWSNSSTMIRKDQRVEVAMSGWVDENERFSGVEKHTFGELIANCPPGPFAIDAATKDANRRCKLLSVDGSIQVGTTTYPGPWLYGLAGATVGFGLVGCAVYCDSPYQEIAIGGMIVGGVVAIVAIVAIASLLAKK